MIKLIGPFSDEHYRANIDGFVVPDLVVHKKNGAKDGEVTVVLDGRFCIDVDEDQLDPWLWIVANAMAIGAGYSCFGEHCQPVNKFKVRMAQL